VETSRIGRRAAQKAETRRRMLESALQLCGDQGFLHARTLDLAKAAGVAHGSVFVHFPTREALLAEVATEFGRRVTDRLHAVETTKGGLRRALAAHLECIAADEALYRHLVLEAPLMPDVLRSGWLCIQSAVSHHIAGAAEREMKVGALKRVPIHLLFNGWIGLVHHYVIQRDVFAPGTSVLERHGPALVAYYVGLLKKESRS
jgi:AcrR family transcriptional regulator